MGTSLYVVRGLSCLLMAYNHSNRCVYRSSTYCDEAELDWCIFEDDQNKVSVLHSPVFFFFTSTQRCTPALSCLWLVDTLFQYSKHWRFGETLPQAPNILLVTPFEVSLRHLRNISDYSTYKKLYSTLPAAVTAAQRARVRVGDPQTIKELWSKRDKTFLALSFVWSERNEKSCLEFGYAAVRCGHMDA